IDLRPYNDPVLDMHDARQSFSARARLERAKDNHDNQAIWFTGAEADLPARVQAAFGVLDTWLTAGARPSTFVDRCWDAAGAEIASGPGVWEGVLDAKPPGA